MPRRLLAAMTALLLLWPLGGCASREEAVADPRRFTRSFLGCMDTVVTLTVYCRTSGEFDAAAQYVDEELRRLDAVFDIYDPFSTVSAVNVSAGKGVPTLSRDVADLVEYCRTMQGQVPGVNVAMGGVLRLWHTAREQGNPPAADALRQAGEHASLSAVRTAGEQVEILDRELSLDFGAVAKGYAARMIARGLKAMGLTDFLLDCGTSTIVCAGSPPGKQGWTVALRNPDATLNLSGAPDPPPYLGTLTLRGKSLGVSGDYQQYFVSNGTYYSHIIDPGTLQPAARYRTVCVVTPDPCDADYLSTALFALPYDQGRKAAENLPGMEALWVMPDGGVRATPGFQRLWTEYTPGGD